MSVLGGLPCRRWGLHWPRQMPVAGQRLARTAMEDARCRRSATAATAWATALVPACCQATRGCASTIPRRGGRRASGCSWCGRADSGTAPYGAGNRRSRMSCTACCVRTVDRLTATWQVSEVHLAEERERRQQARQQAPRDHPPHRRLEPHHGRSVQSPGSAHGRSVAVSCGNGAAR